ncbi:MAG: esterase family protein [Ruminococcaceae bacterium]|nr:esterase family protein [Oscillospiraceae bacterium]
MAVFTGSFLSAELGRLNSISVILPHDTAADPQWGFPVLYLLHGKSDDSRSWLYRSNIERYATERGLCVVMPDAALSFYTDMAYGGAYFSYITHELPDIIRSMFRVSVRREDTYIGGISMGGYGALKCALRKPELYAGCIALSPLADIARIQAEECRNGEKNMWKGICGEGLKLDESLDLFQLLEQSGGYVNMCPRIYIACGKQDDLFDDNIRLKDSLDAHRIEFTFEQAAAGHEWGFWDVALQRGMDIIINNRR